MSTYRHISFIYLVNKKFKSVFNNTLNDDEL